MGVQALGVGHDQDEMGYYLDDAALRVAEGIVSQSVSFSSAAIS